MTITDETVKAKGQPEVCLGRIVRRSCGPRLVFIGNPFAVEERVAETLRAKIKAMEKLDNLGKADTLVVSVEKKQSNK